MLLPINIVAVVGIQFCGWFYSFCCSCILQQFDCVTSNENSWKIRMHRKKNSLKWKSINIFPHSTFTVFLAILSLSFDVLRWKTAIIDLKEKLEWQYGVNLIEMKEDFHLAFSTTSTEWVSGKIKLFRWWFWCRAGFTRFYVAIAYSAWELCNGRKIAEENLLFVSRAFVCHGSAMREDERENLHFNWKTVLCTSFSSFYWLSIQLFFFLSLSSFFHSRRMQMLFSRYWMNWMWGRCLWIRLNWKFTRTFSLMAWNLFFLSCSAAV